HRQTPAIYPLSLHDALPIYRDRLPAGISGLSAKIHDLGMMFGLWFEPEMTNKDSDLYRQHPDYIIETPNRHASQGRKQYVLDFSDRKSTRLNSSHVSISYAV